mgnify:CR=1
MFDPTTTVQYIETMVAGVAARCPITLDRLTIGSHPDGARRDEGELGLIDWDRPGGHLVDTIAPEAEFVRRAGPLRAMGAALLAADKYHPACADLPIGPLVEAAEKIAREVEGGPEDAPLRMGHAARAAALSMLGQRGSHDKCMDWRGDERSLPENSSRPEAVLPIHPWDFETLTAAASCREAA